MIRIAVVGGGPAGLMAAWQIALDPRFSVDLYEKNDQVGKKILASGGGMCNYTQHADAEDFFNHYGDHGLFLKHGFKQLDAFKTEALLQGIGIDPHIREDGKVFPQSKDAKQWLGAFSRVLAKCNVKVHTKARITHLGQNAEGFWLLNDGGHNPYRAVVLATGGASYPALGTSGDGYQLLSHLGLHVVKPKPALTAVQMTHPLKGMEGIVLPAASVQIKRGNTFVKMAGNYTYGPNELLITHKGLSGPLILNCSRWIYPGDQLIVNWLGWTPEKLDEVLLKASEAHGKRLLASILEDLPLPKRFVQRFVEMSKIEGGVTMANLSKKSRQLVVGHFCAFAIDEFELVGFHQAMATAGGLDLNQVNSKTMGIKEQSNLYVVGELLDIDGDTGGFNIQAALTTGFVAAKAILRDLVK